VIVQPAELPRYRGQVTMVDGGFDPIHAGHVDYFRAATELGLPVLCNVTGDEYVRRKHPPLLPQEQRVAIIDAIRYITFTHPSPVPTEEVLAILAPAYYAKGEDWRGRLPAGEVETCERLGIEIVFLDTVRTSSTAILSDYLERQAIGR
jgi:cytidyltransferase-like protein